MHLYCVHTECPPGNAMLYEGDGLRDQVEEMDVVEHEATAW